MRFDFKIFDQLQEKYSSTGVVPSGTTQSINAGEPTKVATIGQIAPMVDADGTTTQRFSGIAKSDSSETSTVAGTVTVWLPLPGILYSGLAKTASLANTQALIDAMYGKRVIFDLTSAKWTIDTAAADASTNGVVIVGGDFTTSTLYWMITPAASMVGH